MKLLGMQGVRGAGRLASASGVSSTAKYSSARVLARSHSPLHNQNKRITSPCGNLVAGATQQRRNMFEQPQPNVTKFPTLMEFPKLVWPSVLKSCKNWITANFIIMPRIDKDFHVKRFTEASKKAVEAITSAMGSGDMSTLKELVTPEAYQKLHTSLSQLSLSQKEELSFTSDDDMYFAFPYEIGLMYNDNDDSKRSVEITMVYHVFKGFKLYQEQMEKSGRGIPLSVNPPYKDKLFVLNYRFIREYRKDGTDSGWTVNVVNHFKMQDLMPTPPVQPNK